MSCKVLGIKIITLCNGPLSETKTDEYVRTFSKHLSNQFMQISQFNYDNLRKVENKITIVKLKLNSTTTFRNHTYCKKINCKTPTKSKKFEIFSLTWFLSTINVNND